MINRKSRNQADLAAWETWKQKPTDDNMSNVLGHLQPLIQSRVREFEEAPVPNAAVETYATALAVRAVETYDPSAGTTLGTWTHTQLQKVHGFVAKYQNIGHIPEKQMRRITPFKQSKERLTRRLGHPPSAYELANDLSATAPEFQWSIPEVTRMEKELRADWISSKSLEPEDLQTGEEDWEIDVLRNVAQELTPEERSVYEFSLGVNGKPKLPAGEIARRMGFSPAKVSRIRGKIDKKLRAMGL